MYAVGDTDLTPLPDGPTTIQYGTPAAAKPTTKAAP
jgi:hypothetical protein